MSTSDKRGSTDPQAWQGGVFAPPDSSSFSSSDQAGTPAGAIPPVSDLRFAFHEGWIACAHMGGTLSEEECWGESFTKAKRAAPSGAIVAHQPQAVCPVCGFTEPDFHAEYGEICGACGTEIGVSNRVPTYGDLHREWVTAGCPWFDSETVKPRGWDAYCQSLRAAGSSPYVPEAAAPAGGIVAPQPQAEELKQRVAVAQKWCQENGGLVEAALHDLLNDLLAAALADRPARPQLLEVSHATCATHGDPLVCLACEAEEAARPEWDDPVLDLDALRRLAQTHRMPRDPFAEQLSAAILRLCAVVDSAFAARHLAARQHAQALAISQLLSDAGVGPCTLPEGVRLLLIRAEKAEAERDKWLDTFNRSEQFQDGPTKRAEAAEAACLTLRGRLQPLWSERINEHRDDSEDGRAFEVERCLNELDHALAEAPPTRQEDNTPRTELERYMPVAADLLPCPFCGEKAVLTNVRRSDHTFIIGCVNEACFRPRTDGYDSQAEVTRLWNRRALADPQEQG